MHESLEWMRINAERERIAKFKAIASETATQYYNILNRFAMLQLDGVSSLSPESSSLHGRRASLIMRGESNDSDKNPAGPISG